jgi:hypothetical protein
VFENEVVFENISDNCPGASRRTQRAVKSEETIGYYTYCEDAGNSWGDRDLLRTCDRLTWEYVRAVAKQEELLQQKKSLTHKASIETFMDREMPFLAA